METVTALQWAIDGLLGFGLLWLAWRALASPDLFEAIVLFVAFGLLMALAWVRLSAPDIALAEAAIGAGLTGALLLSAFARLKVIDATEAPAGKPIAKTGVARRWFPAIGLTLVAGGLGAALLALPPQTPGLGEQVAANLHSSGVGNPVTAVLLNFRGYDTLLEMAVLLLALLGGWSLGGLSAHAEPVPGPVLDTLTRLLAPLLILVAAYMLWVGADAPGGAFQAGSVLGAAAVLLLLSGWQPGSTLARLPLRLALVAGLGAFVTIAALTIVSGERLLEYAPEQAGTAILVIESLATISIGLTLAGLFFGVAPQNWRNR